MPAVKPDRVSPAVSTTVPGFVASEFVITA